jgi:hypothetical protein
MRRKFAPIALFFAVILSVAALAQSGTAAAAPAPTPAASPAASMPGTGINKVGIINIQGAIVASNEGRRDL